MTPVDFAGAMFLLAVSFAIYGILALVGDRLERRAARRKFERLIARREELNRAQPRRWTQ